MAENLPKVKETPYVGSYLYSAVQNELINIISNEVRKCLLDRIKKSTKKSPTCCSRQCLALFMWVMAFFVTFALVIIALATNSWMSWSNSSNDQETERGLFYSRGEVRQSCLLDDLIRKTQDNRYMTFNVDSVAGLLIAGAVVDVIALFFGLVYFYIKGKEKVNLWKIYIPTSIASLTTAALILIGCLVFVMDMSDAIDSEMEVERDTACSTVVNGVLVMVGYQWSFYLALITGGLSCAKGLLFVLLACQ